MALFILVTSFFGLERLLLVPNIECPETLAGSLRITTLILLQTR
jgi:hypothetical protein